MNRKLLSDQDCMSGTGWRQEELEGECPSCSYVIEFKPRQTSGVCKNCGIKFGIEYGVQYLMRVTEEEE